MEFNWTRASKNRIIGIAGKRVERLVSAYSRSSGSASLRLNYVLLKFHRPPIPGNPRFFFCVFSFRSLASLADRDSII